MTIPETSLSSFEFFLLNAALTMKIAKTGLIFSFDYDSYFFPFCIFYGKKASASRKLVFSNLNSGQKETSTSSSQIFLGIRP